MSAKPHLKIIAVGKLREPFWQAAQAEYVKRLSSHTTRLEIIEIGDEPTPDAPTPAQIETVLGKEAQGILAKIGAREYVVALAIEGTMVDSPGLAAHLERAASDEAASAWTFVVGGSLGLHSSVLECADWCISFGKITLPHQLARVVLLEQLYRAGKILRGENYHK